MNRDRRWSGAGVGCLLALLLSAAARLPAQDDALLLARAEVAAAAPATDDPDATALLLLAAARAHCGSPVAALLVGEVLRRLEGLQLPAALRQALLQAPFPANAHGDCLQRVQELTLLLDRATGNLPGDGRPLDPHAGQVPAFLVVGPFGDSADDWVGVPFPPELGFPALATDTPGRFGPVRPRVVARKPYVRRTQLWEPSRRQTGCFFALYRLRVSAPLPCFLELDADGSWQAFLNGVEVARRDQRLDPGPSTTHVAVTLQAGVDQVLLKTCSAGRHGIALRCTDGEGRAVAGIADEPVDAPLVAAPAPAARDGGRYLDGLAALGQAIAAAADDDDRATESTALALLAVRLGATDLALATMQPLRATPPRDPTTRLVAALALRGIELLPDEIRAAEARANEETAVAALPPDHHQALLTRVRHLEDQDQREEALHRLQAAIAGGHGGPETFATALGVVRRLHFRGAELPLLQQWAAACPQDLRPRLQLAERAEAAGNLALASELCSAATALRPDSEQALQRSFALALDLGRFDAARACVDHMRPPALGCADSLSRLQLLVTLARRRGDAAELRLLLQRVLAHAETDAEAARRVGERLQQLADRDAALAAFGHSLQLQTDQRQLQELTARLTDAPLPGADCARFRRDGDAAIAAFHAGEQEQAATSTLLIDQMIVEVRADGSYWSEVHQLRRINDLAGVEANTEAAAAAHADQLLLLRTIATDGSSHVPALVNDTFTMPRLEPGAFVEQRHRNFVRAPGPGGWHTPQFFCRSATEPYELTELVLIVPATEPGELRVRNFPGPPTTIALDDGRRALVFRQEHVHRLPPDQHAPALVDLVPVIAFGRDVGMGPVARQTTLAVFGPSRPTPVVTGFAHTLLQGLGSDADKVAAVHRFCQAEIVDGPGDNATATLLRKKGNRFYLALALLRAADVPVAAAAAMPVRAELRREGTPLFVEETPYVLPAALVQPRDGAPSWWFIDSPRHLPLGEVAGARAGARAVVVATDGLQQQRLPANACTVAQTFAVTGQATVGHGGDVLCTARIELADAAAYGLAEELRNLKADVRKLAARQFAQRFFQDWRIEQAEFADLEPAGRPLALQVKVSRRLLQTDGLGRALLQLPLPPGKFLAAYGDREGRELPLHLTGELQSSWQLTVDLGDEYDIAAIPEPVLLDQGLLAYALSFARSGRQLLVQRQTTVRAGTIPLSAFGDWLRVLRTADRSEEQTLRLSARPH